MNLTTLNPASDSQLIGTFDGSRSILLLIDQLTEMGGAERMMLELARSLPAHGYRATVVTLRDDPSPEAYRLFDAIIVLPVRSCFTLGAVKTLRTLVHIIRSRRIDLIQTFFESADLLGVISGRSAGVKAICSSRRDMGILRSRKHNIGYRLLTPFFDQVFAVSRTVAQWHQRRDGIKTDKLAVVYNGIHVERMTSGPPKAEACELLGVSGGCNIVTTIANINAWKGIDVFIEAAALVRRLFPSTIFLVAGAPTDIEHLRTLQKRAEELDLSDHLHFLGPVEDVSLLLNASDVFALLSRSEGFPNVVIEAMAARVPVVATKVGGTPEAIVDGVTGYLVENEDHEMAANRIISLLTSPDRRVAMGEAGLRRVQQQFSIDLMVKRHVEVYDALLCT